VQSGSEALRQLLKREFAVMLLDVQMPDMDGYEVARHARSHPDTRQVPIIFVTAMHETEETLLRGYGTGAVDLLFKPVSPYVLRSKVQVFLDLYASRRRLADEIEAHKKTMADLEAYNYSVSHDLRAPLRHILGFSEMLAEGSGEALDEKGKKNLLRVREAAQRMSQLLDDLLRLSRITQAHVRRQPVDLSALAHQVLAQLRAREPERQVELTIQPDLQVNGDEGLLRIALENLLGNAWKFTGKKAQPHIEVGARREGPRTVYFVRDDGAGFDPQYADKLFHPFRRLHSGDDFPGTGIGLALVHRIVAHHGGMIRAEAEPGQGATFSFSLGEDDEAGAPR